jgi:hypothetical protein
MRQWAAPLAQVRFPGDLPGTVARSVSPPMFPVKHGRGAQRRRPRTVHFDRTLLQLSGRLSTGEAALPDGGAMRTR